MTLASAFAADRAARGERVLLVSVAAHDDPASRVAYGSTRMDAST